MKRCFTLLLLLGLALGCQAQIDSSESCIEIPIWDNTTAPHSNALQQPEEEVSPGRIAYTQEARLYYYAGNPACRQEIAFVLCPGGGYQRLAMDHEGHEMARWLASQGYTAAVLKYRMPNGHPEVPLEDAVRALEILQKGESALGVPAHARVGIIGCSAGGHLAATVSTMGAIRPHCAILFYPVITGEEGRCHRGSFDHLLGRERTDRESRHYWLEERVDSLTPPTLLLLSDDDRSVPPISSTRYYNALKEQGIRASMHIYPTGGHGWGMRDEFAYKAAWQAAVLDWLQCF